MKPGQISGCRYRPVIQASLFKINRIGRIYEFFKSPSRHYL